MKFNKRSMAVVCLVVICAALTGCKKDKPVVVEDTVTDADRIQGTWQGVELGGAEGQWAMVIEGEAITVDGPGSQDYVGTLALDETTTPKSAILTITECGFTDYIGAKGNNLYKIEDGKLTIAGTEPGSETKPASFEPGNGTRVFEFTQTESQS